MSQALVTNATWVRHKFNTCDSSATSIGVRRAEQECYGAEQWIHSDPVPKASQSTAGSSGGYAKSIGFMEDGRQADGGFPKQLDSLNGFQHLMCSLRSELVGTQLRGHLHVLFLGRTCWYFRPMLSHRSLNIAHDDKDGQEIKEWSVRCSATRYSVFRQWSWAKPTLSKKMVMISQMEELFCFLSCSDATAVQTPFPPADSVASLRRCGLGPLPGCSHMQGSHRKQLSMKGKGREGEEKATLPFYSRPNQ
ncbi:Tryptophan synthase beta chain [Dissostichus eleginoides]|uniref:Tryptophan synthase beta chain n=1 Tax=Dissostichus eleginoides TaxID=100907 RepID=A0AAD9FJZ3_DISEL|nr:Tryptophan synthase beta chain [Dissostichus eleginoides]